MTQENNENEHESVWAREYGKMKASKFSFASLMQKNEEELIINIIYVTFVFIKISFIYFHYFRIPHILALTFCFIFPEREKN